MIDAARTPRIVLVTRPDSDSDLTAAQVTEAGFVPVSAPFSTIRRRRPGLPLRVAAILVTSGNALAALVPGDTPLLAVGDATAERAHRLGFAHVVSAHRDAAALAALAARLVDPKAGPLLLASGAGQGLAIAADLRARGFRVMRRVCYDSVPVTHFPAPAATALRAGEVYAALFMSAATARCFVRLLPAVLHPALGAVLALAIGNAAADALKPLQWRGIRVAPTPTLDDVLALL